MKVVILGASGQIGSVVHTLFSEKGLEVQGTSRSGKDGLLKFDPLKDNWSVLGKVDWLINCCGAIYEKSGESFELVHTGITETIIRNRSLLGNPALIQVSVLGADVSSDVKFFSTKADADRILLDAPETWVIRPSIVCTPGTVMVEKLRDLWSMSRISAGFLPLPAGMTEKKIQPVMGEDVAELCYSITSKKPAHRLINATGPSEISFQELFQVLESENQGTLRVIQIPEKMTRWMVSHVIDNIFPSFISFGQYRMIFSNNVAANDVLIEILERSPEDTIPFWRHELKIRQE